MTNVKCLLPNVDITLAIKTTGVLTLQLVHWRYNYITDENDITTRVLRNSYLYMYVLFHFLMAMKP